MQFPNLPSNHASYYQPQYDKEKLIQEQLGLIPKNESLCSFASFLSQRDGALQKLGMLLWAYNHKKNELEKMLGDKTYEEAEIWLLEALSLKLEKIQAKINKSFPLQPSHLVKRTLLPQKIAKLIVTKQGEVNVGLIEYVKDRFLEKNNSSNLSRTLSLFLASESTRKQLYKINAPLSESSPAAAVIRASLNLPAKRPITRADALRTSVAALLSHLRQEEKHSCFAAFVAINMQQSHLKTCIKDFTTLLRYSHLTRDEKGLSQHYPFLLKMSNQNLNDEFFVDKTGKISAKNTKKGYLWDSVGLLASCKIMGIENPKETLLHIAKEVENPTTPQKIIKRLAAYNASKAQAKLYQQGCFAFGSKTYNPLLKVWVNAIAGMGEREAGSLFGSCIIKTVLKCFHQHLASKRLTIPLVDNFEKELFQNLSAPLQLIYDPSVGTPAGKEGGFVLYEGVEDGEIRRLKRIDNEADFCQFLKRALLKCKAQKGFVLITKILISFIDSPSFSETLLTAYREILSKYLSPYGKKITGAPWINLMGHDSSAIMKIYLNNIKNLKTKCLTPENGGNLLEKLIIMGKELDEHEKTTLKNDPYLLKPARIINYHAFSLMIGHPSLQRGWRDQRSSKKWISEEVLVTGKEVANAKISDKQRKLLIREFNAPDIPALPIKKFRNALLEKIPSKNAQTMLKLDQRIAQTLPKTLKKKLSQTIIHFADTNLHQGKRNVHFVFIVNPGTGKIEVWQAADDNSKLSALDQNLVVKNRLWEIFFLL